MNDATTEVPILPKTTTGPGLIAWIALVLFALVVVTAFVVGWAVRHTLSDGERLSPGQKEVILFISNFPALVRESIGQIRESLNNAPSALLVNRASVEGPQWRRSFPSPADPGYLLFAGLDPVEGHALVKLLRISDGKEMARWDPDWPYIYDHVTDKKMAPKGSFRNAIAMDPILLPTGDIIFNINLAVMRLNACSRQPAWLLDIRSHHSNELDSDGTTWHPSVTNEAWSENSWIRERIRDDSLAHVAADGKLIDNRSFTNILDANGLGAMVYGTSGWKLQPDPLHINQIRVAPSTGPYWQKGDLLISARHLSAIFLYRPSTGKIYWHQQGPWLNQHSPDFVGDHQISVFDNNVYAGAPPDKVFIHKNDINRVFLVDLATGETTEPYKKLLEEARPMTISHGRARMLPDGGLFVEDSNSGRHLRFTKDALLWSRVNDFDQERIGQVFWSSYLTADEAAQPLKALAQRQCR